MEQPNREKRAGSQRRKILGWIGLGAVSAIIFRVFPLKKAVSKRLLRKDDEKILISINKNAVKRIRKVTRNV